MTRHRRPTGSPKAPRMRTLTRRLAHVVIAAIVVTAMPEIGAAELQSGEIYDDPIVVTGADSLTTTYAPGAAPAIVNGDISGDDSAVLTVTNTGGGSISLRGDNSAFLGSVTLTSGGIDVTDRAAIPSVLSRLDLAGGDAATRAVISVANGGTVSVDGGGTTTERLAIGAGNYAGIDPGTGTFVFMNGTSVKGVGGNTTLEEGGAVSLDAGANLVLGGSGGGRVVFAGNEARYGGAISTQTGSVLEGNGVDFISNKANAGTYSYLGGAIWNRGAMSFTDSTFTGNLSLNGGAVYNQNATADFTDTTFTGNQATYSYGGAIYNVGTGGQASSVTITGGILSDNYAYYQGGAVYTTRADVSIAGSAITNNTADSNGGGLYNNDGIVDITATDIRGNYAKSNGGGLYNDFTMTLDGGADGMSIASNTAGNSGGGIYNNDNIVGNADLTVTNIEFAGNRAGSLGTGGGIYNQNGNVTLTDSSFLNNYAGRSGAAIYNWNGAVDINVSQNKTVTFAGNTTRNGANSIHVESRARGGIDTVVTMNVADNAVLDLRDPMSGVAGDSFFGPGTISIRKNGNGELRLGGASVFTVAPNADGRIEFIHGSGGNIRFYRAGEVVTGNAPVEAGAVHLEGADSLFSIVAPGNIHIGGGNAISITGDAANWQTAALQGTIEFIGNPTFSFDMREAVADEPMLTIRADTITFTGNTVVIDVYALGQNGDRFLLVEKENNNGLLDFTTSNVTLDLRLRGRDIANAGRAVGAGGENMFNVETEEDRIFLTVNTSRPEGINKVLDWSPDANNTWSLNDKNWLETGTATPPIEYFIQDVVNFTDSGGGGEVEVGDNGVTVAGMYVSGSQDYRFTGEGIEVVDGSIDLTGDATGGKLVLGQVAGSGTGGDTTVTDAAFTGTVDFTGISGENRFEGGIDIHSGTLRISAGTHIDPGLGLTSFLGDVGNYGAVVAAVADRTNSAADVATAITTDFPSLRLAGSITFDNAAGDQRLAVAAGKAGSIYVEQDYHAVFQNSSDTDVNGGAVNVGAGSLLVLDGDADALYRFRNNQGRAGGALYSDGTLFVNHAEFTENSAGAGGGGAVRASGGTTRIEDATFQNNQSGADGGAIMADADANTDIRNATFTGNHAGGRGGAIASDGDLALTNVSFLNNGAVGRGGAVHASGNVDLTINDGERHVFSGNRDASGAGSIHLDATSRDASLDIAVTGTGSVLDIRDPLSGENNGNAIAVNLTADPDSTILLGGDSIFTGGNTAFTAVGGTIQLYRDGEVPDGTRNDPATSVNAGAVILNGAGSSFTLGDGATATTLVVGGNNRIEAETVTFTNNTTVRAGIGHDDVATLFFSPATITGTATFEADAGKTLALRGQFTGGGTFAKTGDGEVFLTELGNVFDTLDVQEGVLGVLVGDDVAVTADNVSFANGTGLDIRGFSGTDIGESYTVIQSGSVIANEPSYTILVGGQTSVDFLTASARRSDDETAIVVDTRLTWYDTATNPDGTYTNAHGTFTLAAASDPFVLGTVLADRTGTFATGWDGRTLTKRGKGQLVLTGDNTYTGATVIEDGTLTITGVSGAGLNQSGLVVDNRGVFNLDIDAPASGDFNRTITGTGAVVKDGDGSVRLTGDNAGLSGIVTVNRGELVADNQSAFGSGAIVLNEGKAVLDFDGVFRNDVSGNGILTSRGDILFTGHHATHTGCTIIESGTASLATNFSSGASFSVYGTLAGNGRVGDLTVRPGGTLSPGYSIGTITASNSARFMTGSTYIVEIDTGPLPPADPSQGEAGGYGYVSDLLVVGGVTTIEPGATLEVMAGGLHLFEGEESPDPVRIIQGRHFADGTLFDVVSGSIGLDIRQEILPDGYYLYLRKTAPDFAGLLQGYGTPNARRAAEAFTRIVGRGDGHLTGGLYGFIASLPNDPALIAAAFQQVHGEVFAAGQDAALRMHRTNLDASRRARRAAVELRRTCPGLAAPGWLNDAVAWSTATGSWSDRRHDNGYSGHDLTTGGFSLGLDKAIRDAWFLGVALGYDRGRQRFDTITSRDDIESFRAGLYGGYSRHGWDLDAHLGYTRNRHRTTRDIFLQSSVTSFAASPSARYHDDLLSAGIAVGRDVEWGDWLVRPSAALDYAHLWTSSIREDGASLAELGVDRSTAHVLDATVGVSAGREFVRNGVVWKPEVRADYTRHLGDNRASVTTHFISVPDIPFVAESGRWSRNTARLGASLEARWRDCFSVRAEYDFHIGERYTAHQVSVGFGMTW